MKELPRIVCKTRPGLAEVGTYSTMPLEKPLTPHLIMKIPILRLSCLLGCLLPIFQSAWAKQRPNIIYIIADDMGYGDVSIYNSGAKFKTPHIDRIAAEGMMFTDAHTSSSVCTPTRYHLLTGRYSWRTHLKHGVLNGYGKPLIAENRLTVASLCQKAGYHTAMIGKWHLGMELPVRKPTAEEREVAQKHRQMGHMLKGEKYIDWHKPVKRTPTSNGFDYFWGHGASLDFPPYVYIENNRFTSQKITFMDSSLQGKVSPKRGKSSNKMRLGWLADDFDPVQTLEEFFNRSAEFIRKSDSKQPFFLYVPLTSPHTPIIPTEKWVGKGITPYADFCMQTDAGVGRILKALDDKGIAENTIVIFTTDNGCSPAANIKELESKGHYPNYPFRGAKADIWDGGHRVPHVVRWPAVIKPGSKSDRVTVLGDIVATMADILDVRLPDDAAEDSVSFYSTLKGQTESSDVHEGIVHHSIDGNFAIRSGDWKLIFCPGSGGWSKPKNREAIQQGLPQYQLYHMKEDPREQNNLIEKHPEVVERLTKLITRFVENGRSTPGKSQKNDGPKHWKQLNWMKP